MNLLRRHGFSSLVCTAIGVEASPSTVVAGNSGVNVVLPTRRGWTWSTASGGSAACNCSAECSEQLPLARTCTAAGRKLERGLPGNAGPLFALEAAPRSSAAKTFCYL